MIYNYLKFSIRNLLNNKAQSLINIFGLALGIACCIMIFLVVRYELSYDTFHSKGDRIYRVNTKFIQTDVFSGGAPLAVAKALKENFPEVEQATTTVYAYEKLFKVGDELYKQKDVVYVAPEYFTILDAKWLAGNPKSALAEPNTVVLTKSVAQKFFGSTEQDVIQQALGKTIKYDGEHELKITGILEDFPTNTDLPFKVLISWITLKNHAPWLDLNDWISFSQTYNHFVLLREGVDVTQLQHKLPAIEKKYMGVVDASRRTHLLQPLSEMHFDERFGNYSSRVIAKENIAGLVLIGMFILLIACINFINLATAQSVKRSKEVGVRKVLGAKRSQLVWQFLTETSLLSFLALFLGLVFSYLFAPQLKALLGLNFTFRPFTDLELLGFLLAVTTLVSLLAGIYPALILSGYQPIAALKNKVGTPKSSAVKLRQSLIVAQFAIAQVLIIGTLVVSSQLEYFRSIPMGFDQDAIITINFPSENKVQTSDALRNQLEQIPGVQKLSYALEAPSAHKEYWSTFTFAGSDPSQEYYTKELPIDHTYLETYGLTLLAGKNLEKMTDSSQVLVNETLLETMNINSPEEAIGQTVNWDGQIRPIAGVVKDFNTKSTKESIPNVIMHRGKNYQMLGIKLAPARMRETIAQIETIWEKTYPESLFEFSFLDETIAGYYQEEVKLFRLFRILSGIAIFICCLGLYGLVSFMAVQRTKEIGIRKVLGASISTIVFMMSKDFIKLVCIAILIASPIAWYYMNKWVAGFENQVDIGWGVFATAGLFALFIAFITISYQAIKAAMTNPVKNLRTE